jgi:hypothetical protein
VPSTYESDDWKSSVSCWSVYPGIVVKSSVADVTERSWPTFGV